MKAVAKSGIRPDGKASFDAIYDQATPAAYFSALRPLEYMAPGRAQPLIQRCVEALRRLRGLSEVTVLDLCAGYGINGALLKHRLSLHDLYERFATPHARAAGAQRIVPDALWFQRHRRRDARVRVIAQDVAQRALAYGQAVGLADAVVAANLEEQDPAPEQAALLREADLVVVTGGLSYIGEPTFARVLRLARRQPWALYFPLRHTDTGDIDDAFEDAGYAVETARRLIPHRRFRGPDERQAIRERVLAQAAPGEPNPSPTHLEALIKLARPENELFYPPFDEIAAAEPDRAAGHGGRRLDLGARSDPGA